jgi:hypothetical protein
MIGTTSSGTLIVLFGMYVSYVHGDGPAFCFDPLAATAARRDLAAARSATQVAVSEGERSTDGSDGSAVPADASQTPSQTEVVNRTVTTLDGLGAAIRASSL